MNLYKYSCDIKGIVISEVEIWDLLALVVRPNKSLFHITIGNYMSPDTTELYDHLISIKHSRADVASFYKKHQELIRLVQDIFPLPELKESLPHLPPLSNLRAASISLFENPRGTKYILDIQAWTDEARWFNKSNCWKGSVRLWDADTAMREMRITERRSKRKLNPVIKTDLLSMLDHYTHVGMIYRKTPADGLRYYDDHYVGVNLEDGMINTMWLHSPNTVLTLNSFVGTDAKGNPFRPTLKGSIVTCQCRMSDDMAMRKWMTQTLTDEAEEI